MFRITTVIHMLLIFFGFSELCRFFWIFKNYFINNVFLNVSDCWLRTELGRPIRHKAIFFLITCYKNSSFLFLKAWRNTSKREKHAVESNLGPGSVDLILLATTPNDYDLHSKRPKIFNQKPKRQTLKTFFRGKQVLNTYLFLKCAH